MGKECSLPVPWKLDFDDTGLPRAIKDADGEHIGYCLLRDARYQKALFLYGSGANGKSTFLDVLCAMVGEENTSSTFT